jgi:hypothetical protein
MIVYVLNYVSASGDNYFMGVFKTPKRARKRVDNFTGEDTKGLWKKAVHTETRDYFDTDTACTFYIQSQEVR